MIVATLDTGVARLRLVQLTLRPYLAVDADAKAVIALVPKIADIDCVVMLKKSLHDQILLFTIDGHGHISID